MRSGIRAPSIPFIADGNVDIYSFAWPASRLGEAIEVVARKSSFLPRPVEAPVLPDHFAQSDDALFGKWVEIIASRMGLEAEAVESSYADVDTFIRKIGPALLCLPPHDDSGERSFLVLLKATRRRLRVVMPNLSVRHIPPDGVRNVLCEHLEAPLRSQVTQLLTEAEVPESQQARTQKAILRQWLGMAHISGVWVLRIAPGANMMGQSRFVHLPAYALILFGVHSIQLLLGVIAWWVIGNGALLGHFDWAWLIAWTLLMLTIIPFQLLGTWAENMFSTWAGALFKLRLLYGTLQLEPEETRHQGAGQFLCRIMDAEAVETLALTGGFKLLFGCIEIAIAATILSLGAGGILHTALFLGWCLFTILLGWRYLIVSRQWTNVHRDMTNELVEGMVGHRTRLAQADERYWHEDEDQILALYLKMSRRVDRVGMVLKSAISRGWLLLGLTGIVSSFILGTQSPALLAISLGGIMLGMQALNSLVLSVQSIVSMLNAWGQISPVYQAASRSVPDKQGKGDALPSTLLADVRMQSQSYEDHQPLLAIRDLFFRYPQRPHPVLQGCSLQIHQGDRILLEGPSGGGKSTFASLLIGLRKPVAGLLLLRGFDQQTIGMQEWRRRVVAAPQFHENHVLSETLAFNLLMGRRWPPTPDDIDEAETMCRELGLGDLIDRMPSGLQQMVGESGWQLSHGERSRVYIARALLQQADLIVLDESFAALDPENLQRALQCVLQRAPALLVIAHP